MKNYKKKTDFPNLERLPDHDSFKHFLSVLSNMPKSFLFGGFSVQGLAL